MGAEATRNHTLIILEQNHKKTDYFEKLRIAFATLVSMIIL